MHQALYPKERYPQGHPDLAMSLNNLGLVLSDRGPTARRRGYFERALAMYEALYPKERYPQGHPDLAISLNNLGLLFQTQGDYGEARVDYERLAGDAAGPLPEGAASVRDTPTWP